MATLDHPYHFDSQGRTATTGARDHIRDLIEQVLFTSPGERVMRPDFGCGIHDLVFATPSQGTLGEVIRCDFAPYPNVERWLNNMRKLGSWKKINEAHYGFQTMVKDRPFQAL